MEIDAPMWVVYVLKVVGYIIVGILGLLCLYTIPALGYMMKDVVAGLKRPRTTTRTINELLDTFEGDYECYAMTKAAHSLNMTERSVFQNVVSMCNDMEIRSHGKSHTAGVRSYIVKTNMGDLHYDIRKNTSSITVVHYDDSPSSFVTWLHRPTDTNEEQQPINVSIRDMALTWVLRAKCLIPAIPISVWDQMLLSRKEITT